VSSGMRKLVRLIISLCQRDENTKIMLPRSNLNARPGKLSRQLIKAPRRQSLLRTIDEKCGYGRMVRSLFREIRNLDFLPRFRCRDFYIGDPGDTRGRSMARTRVDGFDRGSCAASCARNRLNRSYQRSIILDFPITLLAISTAHTIQYPLRSLTRKNSPSVELYGLHGFPFTYFRSFVNQNLSTSSIRSNSSFESPIAMNVFG
jgi:hypothetical protein